MSKLESLRAMRERSTKTRVVGTTRIGPAVSAVSVRASAQRLGVIEPPKANGKAKKLALKDMTIEQIEKIIIGRVTAEDGSVVGIHEAAVAVSDAVGLAALPSETKEVSTVNLYRHFNAKRVLLYVGISLSAVYRLSQHRASPWANEIAHVEIENFPSREEALEAENRALKNEKPLYNVVGKSIRHQSQTLTDFTPADFDLVYKPAKPTECAKCARHRKAKALSMRNYREKLAKREKRKKK